MALELSLFFDESGSDAMDSKYYLLAIALHDQSNPLADDISKYEQSLRDKGLADIPFHASPLMNGHGGYEGLDAATRRCHPAKRCFRASACSSGTCPSATGSSS